MSPTRSRIAWGLALLALVSNLQLGESDATSLFYAACAYIGVRIFPAYLPWKERP